jgi:hypothetical protein
LRQASVSLPRFWLHPDNANDFHREVIHLLWLYWMAMAR